MDIANIIISGLAFVFSIFAIIKTKSNSEGNIELYINERITTTKENVTNIVLLMSSLSAKNNRNEEEERILEIYTHALNSSIENNLNAYEEACAKYLDNKVDKKRFKKTFKTEIRQLVENEEYQDYFNGVTSKYRAILKVYNSWENLEK